MDFLQFAHQCAPHVAPDTVRRVIQVESAFNPYAIGVVGARLARQPDSPDAFVATAHWLDAHGFNYSVGLMQVNRRNFENLGLVPEIAWQPCVNVRAGAAILTQCYVAARERSQQSQAALRIAFSCYESGNFSAGFRNGYVQKVVAASAHAAARPRDLQLNRPIPSAPSLLPATYREAHVFHPETNVARQN